MADGTERSDVTLPDSELVIALAETKVWAMRPELVAGLSRVDRHLSTPRALHTWAGMFDSRGEARSSDGNGRPPTTGGGVAVVGLHGVITPRPSLLMALFGGGSGGLSEFTSDLVQAAANPEARSIVLDIDSPGGLVDQVPETAALIRQVREHSGKPIVAVANTQACSAAYWLASQANEVAVTPSGDLGSIGVYSLHRDLSEAFAQAGVKHTLIHAGKYKIEGNPYEPLDPDALAAEQAIVDDYYGMFIDDVATGRGVDREDVASGYGEGRSLTAKRAVKAGLADRTATLGDTINRLSTGRARVKRQPEPAADEPSASPYTKNERLRLLDALVASR